MRDRSSWVLYIRKNIHAWWGSVQVANFTLIVNLNCDVPEDLQQFSNFHQSALHSDHFHPLCHSSSWSEDWGFFFVFFCLRSANGWLRKPRGLCDKNANRSCWTLGWICSCLLMFDEYAAGESFPTGNIACWKSREHSFIFSSYTNTLLSLDAFVVYYII